MICPRCQHENPAGVKFCGECWARLESLCTACQVPNPPTNKFCHACGSPLTAAPPAVKGLLKRLLAGQRPGIQDVARELHLSTRTLQRRLTEQGHTFQQVLEDASRELARHYLVHSSLELNETAYLLATKTRIRSSARSTAGRVHRRASGGTYGRNHNRPNKRTVQRPEPVAAERGRMLLKDVVGGRRSLRAPAAC